MSNNYENKYSLSAIIQLLNPDNTISAHRMLAHAIGMTETMIYFALISKQTSEILEDVESVENVEKPVQTAEKLQFLPKAVTDEGTQSSCPSAVTCTRPADNHTIKPKINNLKLNQSIDQTDRLISALLRFSEILENLGLDWYTFTANEPMSEKHFLYHDETDRKTQKCKIPYSLKNDKRNMKSAL